VPPRLGSVRLPNDAPDIALAKLWDAIFETTRINGPDPVAPGRPTTPLCKPAPRASMKSATLRCNIAAQEPTSVSASPTIISGSAAAPQPEMASTAFPTCH